MDVIFSIKFMEGEQILLNSINYLNTAEIHSMNVSATNMEKLSSPGH